ncbi:MAG TPA: lipopolysaccharide heptosyltransferase I [Deltaproteobacteria bacterium]|nr:lipopolysaccharide heptosyltransferase I [Deltaproteobacteria bacterium]
MKIALVRLSSLGDIILGMVCLQLIRRQMPGCRITWVADSRFADILDHQPDIQQLIRLNLKGLKRGVTGAGLMEEYRKLALAGPFDAVIDLHGMIKSAITARLLGGPVRGFDRRVIKEPLAGLFYRQTFDIPLEMPAASRYAHLVMQSLGLPFELSDLARPEPFLFAQPDDFSISAPLFSDRQPNVIIVPGTSAANKNYPAEGFARLAEQLNANIMLCHGNQQEQETACRIAALAANTTVLPRLNLNQLKAAISRADLVIGGDSGPTHIAWGCAVPSVTLYGATPVCIVPTEINCAIKTASNVNLRKPDTADLSIRNIPEGEILRLAKQLLDRRGKENA